jgi:hypothetical protein
VTALWTVIALLSVIVMIDSVVIIALTRQIGLLHLRSGPPAAAPAPARRGPQPGRRLQFDEAPAAGTGGSEPDLVLYGFVRPECGSCATALPAFTSVASAMRAGERTVLVSDADEVKTRAYLGRLGVTLPLLTGPELLQANDIPGTPYAVVTDRAGAVIAASAAFSADQLETVLDQARRASRVSAA